MFNKVEWSLLAFLVFILGGVALTTISNVPTDDPTQVEQEPPPQDTGEETPPRTFLSEAPEITEWEGVLTGYKTDPEGVMTPLVADVSISLECGLSQNPVLRGETCKGNVLFDSPLLQGECILDGYHAFADNWTGTFDHAVGSGDCGWVGWTCNQNLDRFYLSARTEDDHRFSGSSIGC